MGCAGAIGHLGRAHAARDGFVIRERAMAKMIHAPKGDVVHGAVTGGGNEPRHCLGQRAQHHVRDALRRFHIACGHRSGRLRVHHRPQRRDHFKRPHDARGVRNVFAHQATKHICRGRNRYSIIRIHRAFHLLTRSCEINSRSISVDGHRSDNFNGTIDNTVVVERIFEAIFSARQAADGRPHHALAVILQRRHIAAHFRHSILGHQIQEPLFAAPDSHALR